MTRCGLALSLIAALLLSGCKAGGPLGGSRVEVVRIADIRTNPTKYSSNEIAIEGVVEQLLAVPFADEAGYEVRDETGSLWVTTTQGLPPKASRVRAVGSLKLGVVIGNQAFGILLVERERR